MARKTLKCPKCERKFALALHLARHVSAIHGKKGRKVAKKRPKAKRRVGRPKGAAKKKVGRPKGVAKKKVGRPKGRRVATRRPVGDPAASLLAEMRSYQGDLLAQRRALEAQINAIIRAIDAMGVAGGPRARKGKPKKRARATGGGRPGSLKSFILKVVRQRSKPMGPVEIAARVARAGYKSKAKDLPKLVSKTLPNVRGVKRVGRGMYRG
jgi:hypothetical protein